MGKNDKMHGIKRCKDANKYSAASQRKGRLKQHTKLAVSHVSKADFLGAGPILLLATSFSDLCKYDTPRKKVNLNQ